jgi:hypothetical protein
MPGEGKGNDDENWFADRFRVKPGYSRLGNEITRNAIDWSALDVIILDRTSRKA